MWYAVANVLVALAAFTVINRLRGFQDWKPSWLKGRPLYYMTGAVFLFVLPVWTVYTALAFAATYFIWGVFPWGRWYDMEALPDDYTGPPSPFEKAIEAVSFGSDYVAMLWRHLFILPGLLVVGYLVGYPWWVIVLLSMWFSFMVATIYAVCRMVQPKSHTIPAEYMTGTLWGVVFLLMWGLT